MPTDLTSELKNRLKRSPHASVGNLRNNENRKEENSASSGVNVVPEHNDAISLVRNLSSLGQKGIGNNDIVKSDPNASASEGESSGGREITEIIKNSAVARRRKLNDG